MKEEAASTDGEDLVSGAQRDPKATDESNGELKDGDPAPTKVGEVEPSPPPSKENTSRTKEETARPLASTGKRRPTKLERFSMVMFALGALGLALAKIRDRTHAHEFKLDEFRFLAVGITAAVALVLGVLIARKGREGRAWGSIATDVATAILGTYLFASSGLDAANRMVPTRWERLVGIVQEHRSENGQTHAKVWIVDRGVDTFFWRPLPLELEAKIDVYVRRGIFGMRIGTLAPPS